jgi:hypothetical protein
MAVAAEMAPRVVRGELQDIGMVGHAALLKESSRRYRLAL